MSDLVSALPGFLPAYAILVMAASSPGPAVAMLLGIGTTQGRAAALTATVGIALGSVTLNLLTLVGVGLVLSQIAWAMTLIRFIGAAYLAWLAWGAFRKAVSPPAVTVAQVAPAPALKHFIAGYALQVTNPKAIVFWLAIASLATTQGAGPQVITAFVVGAFMISLGCHGAWALLLSAKPIRRAYARARRWIEVGLGTFFAFAAFKLATQRG